MKSKSLSKILGGALLVSGTCIGAGMLGLPVATAQAGYVNTVIAFVGCWFMMMVTALYMLEVTLWYQDETNLISMAANTLGRAGEVVAWVVYMLFLYSLMAAYTTGGSELTTQALEGYGISSGLSTLIFIGLFSLIVYLGTTWVDWMNRLLMLGLIALYCVLVGVATPYVDMAKLNSGDYKALWLAAPLLVTSFGFHLLIPSLKTYLKGDANNLKLSIFIGSLVPLLVYGLWEFIILGVIPSGGPQGLAAMQGKPVVGVTQALITLTQNKQLVLLVMGFSFFAITSSFIGVSLGLFDFLADGLNIRKTLKGRAMLAVLTFLPPALFAYYYPTGFIQALRYAGVFASILLVLFPAIMVWAGRYHRNLVVKEPYVVFGGKPLLILAMLFGVSVIALQILAELS